MGEGKKEKVTIMVLKVDLQCHKCYKKVKKVLSKFPEIRDQVYDEKQNQVVIKVVCCSPEKMRDKICCKGQGAIISIEIKEPEKSKPTEKSKQTEKSKETSKPAEKTKEMEKSKPEFTQPIYVPVNIRCPDCYHGHLGGPCYSAYGGQPAPYVQYDGYHGRPVYDSYGGSGSKGYNSGYYVTHPDCFSEENPQACMII